MHITTSPWIEKARKSLRELGPYAALFVLPGGSLLAPALWVYRHWPLTGDRK